ncbi:MAG: isoprenyl transferase [Firmicutes bacterium]|nr:isoprenyl transferase [Bacillota bacterium]MCM1401625.1 isoprenyl transferase [Bacteroides sp.]MCM1477795.1 isoprenyl transferase [Bacteroides sp.]
MTESVGNIDRSNIPAHVAIIMDGNGRWAKARGLERTAGHTAGVDTVRTIITAASQIGVKYLTLYAFSTENWNRPQAEVDALLHLIVTALEHETPDLIKNNVCLKVIGDIDRMPELTFQSLQRSLSATAHCTGLQVNLALSYSSRWEIVAAARRLAAEAAAGHLDPSAIDETMFSSTLATAGLPDPDLLIRTGGDSRVSSFLLWQIAYSELFFSPKFWPEFTAADFENAIANYQGRERRFGLTSEQVASKPSSHSSSN